MESESIPGNNNSFEENIKRYRMSLLYVQTIEIQKLYNSTIEEKPRKYY